MEASSINTVYVRNLEERVKPDKLHKTLTSIFEVYGTVIDIVIKTNIRAKGQAFVVYDNHESAQRAVDEIDGFELWDKPMHVALARTRSDATVRKLGNPDEFELHKRRRLAEKDKKKALEAAEEQKRLKRQFALDTGRGGRAGVKANNPAAVPIVPDEYLPPNKTLFIQNLPDDCGVEALTSIFSRFPGFQEVRTVPGRKGIAFVEYEAEQGAITAKENTAGTPIGESQQVMKVTYQRQ